MVTNGVPTLFTNRATSAQYTAPTALRSTLQPGDAAPVLPLAKGKRLLVVGPNADTKTLMAGGTGGGLLSANVVCKCATSATDWCCIQSPSEAINLTNTGGSTTVLPGCSVSGASSDQANTAAAVAAAQAADAVVFVLGGDWAVEHEGMDRSDITLPGNQAVMVSAVAAVVHKDTPLVVVMINGGSMDISSILKTTHATVGAFYPGMHGAQVGCHL